MNKTNAANNPAIGKKITQNSPQNAIAVRAQKREGYIRQIAPKSTSQARQDIATWQSSKRAALNVESPRQARLQNLYKDIREDAHLTSQLELRTLPVLATPFTIKKADGSVNEEATNLLNSASWVEVLNRHILETSYHGHTLLEFERSAEGIISTTLLPRTNVVPGKGLLLLSQDDDNGIAYRDAREYGSWVIEFGSADDLGLLNKAVPHVLFMRFAQSCWSELCEIYGIPPRFIKTDTTDPEMLDRAEKMLRDMGSAAYFIIDNQEEFEFAKGADTNGDVYKNLMSVCKEALSVLINGGQVGQDTSYGNRSKEDSSQKLLDNAQKADKRRLTMAWNERVIPALVSIGVIDGENLTFELQPEEDIEKLWQMVTEILPYKDIPNEFIEKKFGITVRDKQTQPLLPTQNTANQNDKKLSFFARLLTSLTKYLPAKEREELQKEAAEGGVDFFA